MTASVTVTPGPELADVHAILEEVWRSFLGDEDPLLPADRDHADPGWSAAVTVSGKWEAMVTVELSAGLADEVTRRMLGGSELTEEDIADAVGELVNMIGGNVKSLMPGPSTLSLPMVTSGRVTRGSDTTENCRVDAHWRGLPLAVSVLGIHPGRHGQDGAVSQSLLGAKEPA